MRSRLPVLDGQVSRADIEPVGVVAGGLAVALRVGGISGSCVAEDTLELDISISSE